ncbi:MFS transporter, partial [Chloroflexota bacterium]
MIKRKRFPRIFFGWWTVLITSIWSGLGSGFYSSGISVLFKPIATELDISRAVASIATGIGRLEGGLESLLTGWLCDKYGPKWVIFTGSCIFVIGLVLMNFINSLWDYILVWGVIMGFGCNLAFSLAMDKALTNWFVRKRGLAFGARFVLLGIAGVITLLIVAWLIDTQGWRMTNLIWAGVIFVGLPFLWYFVKQKRPEYYGLLPDGAKMGSGSEANGVAIIDKGVEYTAEVAGEVEFTLRQALKTPSYWLLAIGYCGGSITHGAVTIHIIPFLTDMGIDVTVAGGMMATMVFFQIPSRFFSAFLCDRLRVNYWRFLLVGSFLFQVMGITIILLNQSIAMIYVFLILYGFGSGAVILVRIMMEGRYFGRKAFASIHGITNVLHAPIGFV